MRVVATLSGIACLALFFVWAAPATAKEPVPLIQRACDMLAETGGERLLGIRLDDGQSDTARLLVRRAWLKAKAPKSYDKIAAAEREAGRKSLERLIDRLERWRERRSDDKALAGFLDRQIAATRKQLEKLDQPPDDGARRQETELLFVELPRDAVRRQQVQSPQRRALLALAWQHGIADAEEISASELVKRLKAAKVDPALPPDLSDRVPPMEMDDRQWSAKVALVEYSLLGKPHYQGTPSQLFDSAEDQRPGLDQLLAGLGGAGPSIEDLLKLAGGDLDALDGPDDAPPSDNAADEVLRKAAEAETPGVRITQLSQDAERGTVTVRGRFMARMPDGGWQAVWDITVEADANRPRPETEKEVAADPQVSEALEGLKKLGLAGGDALVAKAIRHGAATLEAQRALDKQFSEFLLRSTRRLDGPTAWSDAR
jgi:hypothetical protein